MSMGSCDALDAREAAPDSTVAGATTSGEITESVFIDNADGTTEVISALSALGCTIALDDFDTGYSSLSYLHTLPADVLTIDRSFAAEGIEEVAQARWLRGLGCRWGQGYLYSTPVPASELLDSVAALAGPAARVGK